MPLGFEIIQFIFPNKLLEEYSAHEERVNVKIINKQCPGTKVSVFTNKKFNISQKASKISYKQPTNPTIINVFLFPSTFYFWKFSVRKVEVVHWKSASPKSKLLIFCHICLCACICVYTGLRGHYLNYTSWHFTPKHLTMHFLQIKMSSYIATKPSSCLRKK